MSKPRKRHLVDVHAGHFKTMMKRNVLVKWAFACERKNDPRG